MDNITIFDFGTTSIRTGDIDGKPVFCLTDLLVAMGSTTRPSDAKSLIEDTFGDGVVINIPTPDSLGREQETSFVFEAGATFLISRSRTETGKKLNRWLHAEVLPSIRKTGSYSSKPKTALELAKEQVKLLEQIELQEIQIKLLEQENEHLAEAVDELFQYSSIVRITKFNGIPEANFNWRKLKATSIRLGLEVKQVPCPRFGTKNLYHHDVWRYLYPDVILPDTTTLRLSEGDECHDKSN